MEELIIQNLIMDSDYFGKVYGYLTPKHFYSYENIEIFRELSELFKEYDNKPTARELGIRIKNSSKIKKDSKDAVLSRFKEILTTDPQKNKTFLLAETEKYIQKIELSEAILKSVDIINKGEAFNPVIGLIEKAISITFNYDTGLDYNSEEAIQHLYDYYKQGFSGITSGVPSIDKVLEGGFRTKTLNIVAAPSHGGKSLFLISAAASQILKGKNVLYLSLEMSEEEIARRIDANLMHHNANDIGSMSFDEYKAKREDIRKHSGKLRIKEYSSGYFNTLRLESLLVELENEDNFIPDIIIIDYLTLLASSRTTLAQAGNNYSYYKNISEELHGFAKKYGLPVLSAAQLNRSAYGNMDVGMDSVADSLGIVQTADVFFVIITSDQLKAEGLALIKFLKNRNTGKLDSVTTCIDYPRMKFTDYDGETDNYIDTGMKGSSSYDNMGSLGGIPSVFNL
jgi:replicative DNA helicase